MLNSAFPNLAPKTDHVQRAHETGDYRRVSYDDVPGSERLGRPTADVTYGRRARELLELIAAQRRQHLERQARALAAALAPRRSRHATRSRSTRAPRRVGRVVVRSTSVAKGADPPSSDGPPASEPPGSVAASKSSRSSTSRRAVAS